MKTPMTLNEAMFLLLTISGDSYPEEDIDENDVTQRELIAQYFRNESITRPFFVLKEGQEVPDYVAFHLDSTGGEGEGDYCDTHIVIFGHDSSIEYMDLRKNGDSLNCPDNLVKFLEGHAEAIVCLTGSYDSYEGSDWGNGEIGLVSPHIQRSVSYHWI